MAIAATLVEDEPAVRWPQKIGAMIKAVAFRAKLGPLYLQHKLFGGAVRVVASDTVFAHRHMFPQERTALLGVARIAGIVHLFSSIASVKCRADYGNPNR